MVVIERPGELERIVESKKWVLVYGRRKTGKSFLVENFVQFDEYFFIKSSGGVVSKKDDKNITYETFIEIVKRSLSENKTIVVDEFHRLGTDFLDFLHITKKSGKIILISSTLFLSKKLIFGKSPILGLFSEVPINLISLKDCLNSLRKYNLDKKGLLESAVILREPIAVDFFSEKKETKNILSEVLIGSIKTIPALIGEIFSEEERHMSDIYEGIMRAIADGKVVSGEISSWLFSRKLIAKDDPSTIQQHLVNLVSLGIIKKMEVYNKKRFIYKHVSQLVRLFYYADEKYNISERKVEKEEAGRIIEAFLPHIIEDSVREFLAEKFGLKETVIEAADYDIDGVFLKFKKPEILLEVKWKEKIVQEDIKKTEANMEKINAKRKILFVQDKKGLKSESLDIIDISDI